MHADTCYRADATSLTRPSQANVTSIEYRTVYVYDRTKLWIFYDCAIALTISAVLIGMTSMCLHGHSYSNRFSTIFLATCGAKLDCRVSEADLRASDPLPGYLQDARVTLLKGQEEESDSLKRPRQDGNDDGIAI